MAGPEGARGGYESLESGEQLGGSTSRRTGCLRWAVEVGYDDSVPQETRREAATVIREAVVGYTDTSFQLECGGMCRAGCELFFYEKSEPPVAEALINDQGITNLSVCEQTNA